MENEARLKTVIVGAGRGGSALLECLTQVPHVLILGVADKQPGAPGLERAAALRIPVTTDPLDLISRDDVDVIMDVTGDPEMPMLILQHKTPHAELFSGAEVKLLWRLMQNIIEQEGQIHSLMEQVKSDAIHDALTGLYNRRHFNLRLDEDLNRSRRYGKPLSLLLCDLDHFKSINDLQGHRKGDEVLRQVSALVRRTVRQVDLVFRWGGDEIAILLPETEPAEAQLVARRIREVVLELGKDMGCPLGVSIGIASHPDHGRDAEALLSAADSAMYAAKRSTTKIQTGTRPVTLNEQTVVPHFQPMVRLDTGEVFAYEALSRDPHGQETVIELFARFEGVGLLGELKELCFRQQLRRAAELGITRLFLNVDFRLLRNLHGKVEPPPGVNVILEISEREALDHIEDRLILAESWRKQGFKFACDDVGAGFLSLPFVVRLAPEFIKIDLSVVHLAVTSPGLQSFLEMTTRAFHGFSEGIIAEGIETQEQLDLLKRIGIPLGQGFLLGRPEPLPRPASR
jgi:diguanylate cyclase (GGDEF)-like protein